MADHLQSLLSQLMGLLNGFEALQADLGNVYRQKREALCQARGPRLIELTRSEELLTGQLKELMRQRSRFLQRAQQEGIEADTIEGVVEQSWTQEEVPHNVRQELKRRVVAVRTMADRLRHESWIHWVIAHRAQQSLRALLELIALGGRLQPVYSEHADGICGSGGALLDHSI